MRRSIVVPAILAASLLPAAAAIADGPPSSVSPVRLIGPGQYFTGLVNGVPGSGQIVLACARGARTGHPVAGQSVSVRQAFPPSAVSGLGFTGNASTIAASLRIVSPSATTAAAQPITLAVFSVYGQQASIPTTLSLPCGGSGAVTFTPVQGGPAARAETEAVKFPFISAVGG